jgi:hypothetical protein
MKLLILALLAVATLSLGVAGMAPGVSGPEEIERKFVDMDGDGEVDLIRVYEASTDDPAVAQRCLEVALSLSSRKLTNCKALPAQRGSTLAWHQYGFEPGRIAFTHIRGTSDRTTETELYVWDEVRRDFRLREVSRAFYNTRGGDEPAIACSYRGRHLPRYAYLSRVDREQLYVVLPSAAAITKQACSQQ